MDTSYLQNLSGLASSTNNSLAALASQGIYTGIELAGALASTAEFKAFNGLGDVGGGVAALAAMTAISELFIAYSKSMKSTADAKLAQLQSPNPGGITAEAGNDKMAQISLGYYEVSANNQNNLSTALENAQQAFNPSLLFAAVQTAVANYVKLEHVSSDSKYNIPMNNLDYQDIDYLSTNPLLKKNNPNASPVFPIFGTPFDNLGKNISDNMTNITSFESNIGSYNDKYYNSYISAGQLFKGSVVKNTSGQWVPDPINTFTKSTMFSEYISKTLIAEQKTNSKTQPPGTIKFFIEKLHGRYKDGTPYKKGTIGSQTTLTGSLGNFANRTMFFAYVDSFNESYSTGWGAYSFIGRSEDVPIYKSTKRTITMSFNILADYSIDLMAAMEMVYAQFNFVPQFDAALDDVLNRTTDYGMGYINIPGYDTSSDAARQTGGAIPGKFSDTTETLWEKTTFLSQCMYPYYRTDGKMKEQPFIRLRLGDFYDVVGYMESLQIDTNEHDNRFDLGQTVIGNLPFAVKVNMSFTVFHDNEPNSEYYGFYHRREFDDGTMDPITGQNITSGGVTQAGVTKTAGQPLTFQSETINDTVTNSQSLNLPTNFSSAFASDPAMAQFNNNVSILNNTGQNLQDNTASQKALNAITSYSRLADLVTQLNVLYGAGNFDTSGTIPNDVGQITANTSSPNANVNTQVGQVASNTANYNGSSDPANMIGVNNQSTGAASSQSGPNSVKQTGMTQQNSSAADQSVTAANAPSTAAKNQPKTFQDILTMTGITV